MTASTPPRRAHDETQGSPVERTKAASSYLRGSLRRELDSDSSRFSGDDLALLKFHGTYQQDDRDERRTKGKDARTYSLMVRSRIPGGTMTATQFRVYHDLAQRYGGGALRLTTRQSIQLHGVLKRNARDAVRRIADALLTTSGACGDVVRNAMVTPDPVAGPAQQALREAAAHLSDRFRPQSGAYAEVWLDGEPAVELEPAGTNEEPFYGPTYLPRKFKLGLTLAGDNSIDAYTQDAAFIAHADGSGSVIGYDVLAGGGLGMTHRNPKTFPRLADEIGHVPPERLLATAEAIVGIHRDFGDRSDRKHARLKYVIADRGVEWFRQELERRLDFPLTPFRPVPMHVPTWYGWHRTAPDFWALGLPVPSGRLRDEESVQRLSFLRELAADDRLAFRVTPQQHILVLGVPEAERPRVEALAARCGVGLAHPPSLSRDALACPALPTCGLALTEAERYLPELSGALEAALEANYPDTALPPILRITGCPNGCARPYTAEIGLVGQGPMRFALYLGGDREGTRLARHFRAAVPAAELPELLGRAFGLWRATAPALSFGDFAHAHWAALEAALAPEAGGDRASA